VAGHAKLQALRQPAGRCPPATLLATVFFDSSKFATSAPGGPSILPEKAGDERVRSVQAGASAG